MAGYFSRFKWELFETRCAEGASRLRLALLAFLTLGAVTFNAAAGVNVLTEHNDNLRTGANLNETLLTPAYVNATNFGKLFEQQVDGYVYAQPLYMSGLTIGGTTHNVVFVATENDSVYAFDADDNTGSNAGPLWHTSFIDPANGITPIPWQDTTTSVIYPTIGITGTPVIDATTGTLYVVAATKENGKWFQRLHALDIATGNEKAGSPVSVAPTALGSGTGSVNGVLEFNALTECERAGLLLLNGVVYIGWGSHAGHGGPSHGWITAYNAQTLAPAATFNTTPDGTMGTIWMGGAGLAADAQGNIYVVTGNGDFGTDANGNHVGNDWGDSLLKFSTANGGLTMVDSFTPANQEYLFVDDVDFGSGGVLLVPEQSGTSDAIGVVAGKYPTTYVFDQDKLGGYWPNPPINNGVLESFSNGTSATFSSPAYFNGNIYYHTSSAVLSEFAVQNGMINPVPSSVGADVFHYPGATPSISASGTSNGIVWEIMHTMIPGGTGPDPTQAAPAALYASLASDVSQRLYTSNDAGTRDVPSGQAVKFAVPTIANGKVYVGTSQSVAVYGLLTSRLLLNVNGPGIVNSGFEGASLRPIGAVFTLTGTDSQNGTFSSWTDVNGNVLTRSPTYTFTMTPELVLNLNFVYDAYPMMAGHYTGIIQGQSPGGANTGSIDITVSATGEFTAAILFGGHRFALSGMANPDGSFSTTITPAGAGPVQVSFDINNDVTLTGTITEGAATGAIVGGVLADASHPVPAQIKGKYTLLLPPPANFSGPKGVGYASVKVDDYGRVRAAGALGDGTPFTEGATLTRQATWPFAAAAAGTDYLDGVLTFERTAAPSDIDGQLYMSAEEKGGTLVSDVIDAIGSTFKASTPILSLPSGKGTITVQLPAPITGDVKASSGLGLSGTAPLTIRSDRSTGIFSGSFESGGASGKYGGAIFQDQDLGMGTFMLSGSSGGVNLH